MPRSSCQYNLANGKYNHTLDIFKIFWISNEPIYLPNKDSISSSKTFVVYVLLVKTTLNGLFICFFNNIDIDDVLYFNTSINSVHKSNYYIHNLGVMSYDILCGIVATMLWFNFST